MSSILDPRWCHHNPLQQLDYVRAAVDAVTHGSEHHIFMRAIAHFVVRGSLARFVLGMETWMLAWSTTARWCGCTHQVEGELLGRSRRDNLHPFTKCIRTMNQHAVAVNSTYRIVLPMQQIKWRQREGWKRQMSASGNQLQLITPTTSTEHFSYQCLSPQQRAL